MEVQKNFPLRAHFSAPLGVAPGTRNLTGALLVMAVSAVSYGCMGPSVDGPTGKTDYTRATSRAAAYANPDSNELNVSAAGDGGWQYCIASSTTASKVYVSTPFPSAMELKDVESAFAQMLRRNNAQHAGLECTQSDDKRGLLALRQRALVRNHRSGNAIVSLSWTPFSEGNQSFNDLAPGNSRSQNQIWQYCLAPSDAARKIYLSAPFPQQMTSEDVQAAFKESLSQAGIQHDTVQCPIGRGENAVLGLRQHAIHFNQVVGNKVIDLKWSPLRDLKWAAKDTPDDIALGTGSSTPPANRWQYCLAPARADNKVYVSAAFAISSPLRETETAFKKMLSKSAIQHDPVQCPVANDESSIKRAREYAINFNQATGKEAVNLIWEPTAIATIKSDGSGQ